MLNYSKFESNPRVVFLDNVIDKTYLNSSSFAGKAARKNSTACSMDHPGVVVFRQQTKGLDATFTQRYSSIQSKAILLIKAHMPPVFK